MPATLLTQTQWHGNPRGEPSYAWMVHIEDVSSPYYADGRDVPVIKAAVTDVPFDGYPEAVHNTTTVTLSGIFYTGTLLEVDMLVSDSGLVEPTLPLSLAATIEDPGVAITDAEAAALAATYFDSFPEIGCTALGAVLTFTAAAPYDTVAVEAAYTVLP